MKEKGETRILLLTDIHAPYHDKQALKLAIKFARKKEIDEVIVSELPDLYKVSSWLKNPDTMPFYQELEEVKQVARQIASAFPGKKFTYLSGNHEERITKYLWRHGEHLAGIDAFAPQALLGITELGWEWVDNKERLAKNQPVLQRGELTFLHGHEIKMGWGAVNIAKIMYERAGKNVIMGHFHRVQEWVVRKIDDKFSGCWSVGCLCDLHPEYNPHNNWIHGFAIIHLFEGGAFSVENRKIIEGKVL